MIAGGNHGNGAAFVFSSKKLQISISTKRQLNSEVSEHGVWNFLKHFWIFLFYKKRMFVSSSCKEQNVFFFHLNFFLSSIYMYIVHCTCIYNRWDVDFHLEVVVGVQREDRPRSNFFHLKPIWAEKHEETEERRRSRNISRKVTRIEESGRKLKLSRIWRKRPNYSLREAS